MINTDKYQNPVEFEVIESTYTENKDMPQMHYHKHYEILYVFNNSRTLTIGEKNYTLNKNTVALIPPFIPHMTVSDGILPQKRLLINFSESYVHEIRKVLPSDLLSCFGTPCTVMSIENCFDKFCFHTNQLCGDLSETEQLLEFCQLLTLLNSNSPPCNKNVGEEIIRYVEGNFNEKITLDTLAAKFYLSKYTVSRYFSRYTGTSLPKYLNSIRIINAKRYLKEGINVTDVAFKCGFESTSNFDRVFLSVTGITPSKFKKSIIR